MDLCMPLGINFASIRSSCQLLDLGTRLLFSSQLTVVQIFSVCMLQTRRVLHVRRKAYRSMFVKTKFIGTYHLDEECHTLLSLIVKASLTVHTGLVGYDGRL